MSSYPAKVEIAVDLSAPFNKTVFVTEKVYVEEGNSFAAAFKEVAADVRASIQSYRTHGQIRDLEAGINPKGATHEILNDGKGKYYLKRAGFSAI